MVDTIKMPSITIYIIISSYGRECDNSAASVRNKSILLRNSLSLSLSLSLWLLQKLNHFSELSELFAWKPLELLEIPAVRPKLPFLSIFFPWAYFWVGRWESVWTAIASHGSFSLQIPIYSHLCFNPQICLPVFRRTWESVHLCRSLNQNFFSKTQITGRTVDALSFRACLHSVWAVLFSLTSSIALLHDEQCAHPGYSSKRLTLGHLSSVVNRLTALTKWMPLQTKRLITRSLIILNALIFLSLIIWLAFWSSAWSSSWSLAWSLVWSSDKRSSSFWWKVEVF